MLGREGERYTVFCKRERNAMRTISKTAGESLREEKGGDGRERRLLLSCFSCSKRLRILAVESLKRVRNT